VSDHSGTKKIDGGGRPEQRINQASEYDCEAAFVDGRLYLKPVVLLELTIRMPWILVIWLVNQ
jgi:hypothetical protein